jgi:hypothetical protein
MFDQRHIPVSPTRCGATEHRIISRMSDDTVSRNNQGTFDADEMKGKAAKAELTPG